MLYGYKSTVGIALGTLKLSANICRHNKCRRSLTEPTTQVSTKVCNPKRGLAGETKKNPQNILPLSPSRLRHEKEKAPRPIHARPASAPAAAASHGRQPSPPPTPSLATAALLHSAAARRNPNHGCPIACSFTSTQDVAHPRSPSVVAPDLRTGFVRVWSSSGWHQILPPLLVRWAPLRVLSFVPGKSPLAPRGCTLLDSAPFTRF